jgi:HK97 family phage portal protein
LFDVATVHGLRTAQPCCVSVRIFGRNLSLNPFAWRARNATLTDKEFWDEIFGLLKTASGITITPQKAMGVATVYACVNAISRTFSTLPLKLYRSLPGGGRTEAREHPLYSILHDAPNEEMTSADFRRAVQANATLRQAGYALIVRNGMGEIAELRPIENKDIRPERSTSTNRLGYMLREDGTERWKDASQILHIRGLTFNGITAVDTMVTARECIGLAIALQDNAARFFGNGSRPGAILSHPKSLTDPARVRLKESFEAASKAGKAWSMMLLEEGLTFAAMRSDNDKSQMHESRVQQAKEIAQVFGIPPHKVGILENATFSNIEEQAIEYVGDCILPWAHTWEQTLNQKLLTPEERRVYSFGFVLEGLLRGDIASRYAAYAVGRQWGWLNVDEIRERENMNPLPDGKGQIYLQPLNMGEPGSESQGEAAKALRETAASRRTSSRSAA